MASPSKNKKGRPQPSLTLIPCGKKGHRPHYHYPGNRDFCCEKR